MENIACMLQTLISYKWNFMVVGHCLVNWGWFIGQLQSEHTNILWYGHNFLCTFVLFFTLSPSFYDYLVEIYGNMKASHTSQSNRIREFEMVLNFIWKYQISWTHISFFWENVHEIEHRSFIIIFVCLCKFHFFYRIQVDCVNFFSLFLYEIAFCRFECFFYLHSIY